MFQAESDLKALSQVLLTLRTANTRALPAGEFEQFELPYFTGHILTLTLAMARLLSTPITTWYGSGSWRDPAPCTVTAWREPLLELPRH